MKRLRIWFVKKWDILTSPKQGGLIKSGNWRVEYTTGGRSNWVDYATASSLARVYGGTLHHKVELEP